MTKEELEKEADTPCTKCIFKGKCPSENKEEVYKICKEIGGRKMTKEELIKNQFPNDEFLQSGVSQIVDKCIAELEEENNKLLDVINNQDVKIADLEKRVEKMKQDLDSARESANRQEQWEIYSVLNGIYNDNFEVITGVSN